MADRALVGFRRIADHPATRIALLLAAAAQALLGAFILGFSVKVGTSVLVPDDRRGVTPPRRVEAPVAPGPFALTTTDVVIPGADAAARSFTVDRDGTVWFTWGTAPNGGDRIGRLAPDGSIAEFRIPTPNANAYGIAVGPDGQIWFAEQGAGRIGRMSRSGAFTEFPLGTPSYPTGIVAGPDGNLWFTVPTPDGRDWIGRITTTGTITRFPLEGTHAGPQRITVGPDGNLWFSRGGGVGRITPQGVVTHLPAPLTALSPEGITVGPDGGIWFATYSPDRENVVGRATAGAADPIVTDLIRLPVGAGLHGIVTGPDGNVWVAEGLAHAIARITPGGQITQYSVAPDRFPDALAVAPDGSIWFSFSSRTGRGGFARFTVPG